MDITCVITICIINARSVSSILLYLMLIDFYQWTKVTFDKTKQTRRKSIVYIGLKNTKDV